MGLEWEQVVIGARDPAVLGRWWCDALGWVVVDDASPVFEIQPQPDRLPGILFLAVSDAKEAKNRLHIDLRPDDQAAEVERLIALGASRVDVGQGDVSWVVLADPEGNEFCVLQERPSSSSASEPNL
ncbi:MAG: VOC family protein [Actinobacteria bacterium]|nr:VOC family protein [Actinomycetota bacterium]